MPIRTPLPMGSVSVDDVRSYFGSSSGSWSIGGTQSYRQTRELIGDMGSANTNISMSDLRGAAHGLFRGLDAYPNLPWQPPSDLTTPVPGNWFRTFAGSLEAYWSEWKASFNNPWVSISLEDDSKIQLSFVQRGEEGEDTPGSIGINSAFSASGGQTYNYIIEFECLNNSGHAYPGEQPKVFAGFAGFNGSYRNGTAYLYPGGNPVEGVNVVTDPTEGQTYTLSGSFATRSDAAFIVPNVNLLMPGIAIGESANLTINVTQHKCWRVNI